MMVAMKRLFVLLCLLAVAISAARADVSGPPFGTASVSLDESHSVTMTVDVLGLPNGRALIQIERVFTGYDGQNAPSFDGLQVKADEYVPSEPGTGTPYHGARSVAIPISPSTPSVDGNTYIQKEVCEWNTLQNHDGFWKLSATWPCTWGGQTRPVEVPLPYLHIENLHLAAAPSAPTILRYGSGLPNPTIPVTIGDGGSTDGSGYEIRIYPISDPTNAIGTISGTADKSTAVTWNGAAVNAPNGLYTYKIRVSHSEPGWRPVGAHWQRDVADNVPNSAHTDSDDDTSSELSFSNVSATKSSGGNGRIVYNVSYTLNDSSGGAEVCDMCALNVYYGASAMPIYSDTNLSKTPGTHAIDADIPDCGVGPYYFVVWGRDAAHAGKLHNTLIRYWDGGSDLIPARRRIREVAAVVNDSVAKGPTVTINQASSQSDPTRQTEIHFTAKFSEPVTAADVTASDIAFEGLPTNSQVTVTPVNPANSLCADYDITVVLPAAATATTIRATIPAGAAQNSMVSTSSDNAVSYDPLTVPSGVICVSATTGYRDNDGTTWSRALLHISDAIALAAQSSTRKDIWVAEGTYQVPHYCNNPPGDFSYGMSPGVRLYGGFAGTETQFEQRAWSPEGTQHETVLQGAQIGGSIIRTGDNSVIDGFVFRDEDEGVLTFGSTQISHNRFESSVAQGVMALGGAPVVAYNYFSGNYTGLVCEGCQAATRVHDNIFSLCEEAGIKSYSGYGFAISNNTVVGGSSAPNARGIVVGDESLTIANNIVAFNARKGIVVENGGSVALHNNCVYGNGTSDADNYVGISRGTDLSADPLFSDAFYHLGTGSQCIDAGIDSAVIGNTDFDNKFRLIDIPNQGHEVTNIVDIGALESFVPCAKPLVRAPTGAVSSLAPLAEWTAACSYHGYRIQVANTDASHPEDTWDSGELSGRTSSSQIQHLLTNGGTYQLMVAICNECGWTWSDPVEFTVAFTEPPLPTSVPYCLSN